MKEIDAKTFIEVFSKNLNFNIVDTKIGRGIIMPPTDAFIYSLITGSGYLDNYMFPFTPKGLVKVFYNALDYKFVTGIFDNTRLKNTPYLLSIAKPFLFDSDKIVVPVEFNTETELQEKLKKTLFKEENPTKYIIQRIEKSKNGNGMEPFMEYLACEYFKKNNFIVENQVPLNHGLGSPDFAGYKLKNLDFSGVHLIELSCIRIRKNKLSKKEEEINHIIVGEAKTSCKIMGKQLLKYLNSGFFNEAFEIYPDNKLSSNDSFGLLTVRENGLVEVTHPKLNNSYLNKESQENYMIWLKNYVKYYLIANLTNDEFIEYYEEKNQNRISNVSDIIGFINSLDIREITDKLEEILNNGSVK